MDFFCPLPLSATIELVKAELAQLRQQILSSSRPASPGLMPMPKSHSDVTKYHSTPAHSHSTQRIRNDDRYREQTRYSLTPPSSPLIGEQRGDSLAKLKSVHVQTTPVAVPKLLLSHPSSTDSAEQANQPTRASRSRHSASSRVHQAPTQSMTGGVTRTHHSHATPTLSYSLEPHSTTPTLSRSPEPRTATPILSCSLEPRTAMPTLSRSPEPRTVMPTLSRSPEPCTATPNHTPLPSPRRHSSSTSRNARDARMSVSRTPSVSPTRKLFRSPSPSHLLRHHSHSHRSYTLHGRPYRPPSQAIRVDAARPLKTSSTSAKEETRSSFFRGHFPPTPTRRVSSTQMQSVAHPQRHYRTRGDMGERHVRNGNAEEDHPHHHYRTFRLGQTPGEPEKRGSRTPYPRSDSPTRGARETHFDEEPFTNGHNRESYVDSRHRDFPRRQYSPEPGIDGGPAYRWSHTNGAYHSGNGTGFHAGQSFTPNLRHTVSSTPSARPYSARNPSSVRDRRHGGRHVSYTPSAAEHIRSPASTWDDEQTRPAPRHAGTLQQMNKVRSSYSRHHQDWSGEGSEDWSGEGSVSDQDGVEKDDGVLTSPRRYSDRLGARSQPTRSSIHVHTPSPHPHPHLSTHSLPRGRSLVRVHTPSSHPHPHLSTHSLTRGRSRVRAHTPSTHPHPHLSTHSLPRGGSSPVHVHTSSPHPHPHLSTHSLPRGGSGPVHAHTSSEHRLGYPHSASRSPSFLSSPVPPRQDEGGYFQEVHPFEIHDSGCSSRQRQPTESSSNGEEVCRDAHGVHVHL